MDILVSYRGTPQAVGYEIGAAVARAFRRLGHTVYEYGNYYGSRKRVSNHSIPKHVDILLYVECNDQEQQYLELRHIDAKFRAFWVFDLALYPTRVLDLIRRMRFTHVFTGNVESLSYISLLVPTVYYLPIGVDGYLYQYHPNRSPSRDAIFVGTSNPKRMVFLQELGRYGVQVEFITGLFGDQYARLLQSASIHVSHGVGGGSGLLPARVWETTGSGLPLVVERDNGIETFFEDHTEVCLYQDVSSAASAIRELLNDRALRERIGLNARKRIEAYHTYDKRAEMILDALLKGVRPPWDTGITRPAAFEVLSIRSQLMVEVLRRHARVVKKKFISTESIRSYKEWPS